MATNPVLDALLAETGPQPRCSWCWSTDDVVVGSPAPIPGEVCYRDTPGNTGRYREQRFWRFNGGPCGHGWNWAYVMDGITVTCSSRQAATKGPDAGIAPAICRDCHEGSRWSPDQ